MANEPTTFYDPSYLGEGCAKKKIESVEDALTILASHGMCSGAECKECAVRMYCHGGECDNTMKNATSFLHKNAPEYDILGCLLYGEGDGEYYSDNANDVNSVYEIIKKLLKSPAPENTKSDCKTCKGCSQLTNIGGVPFCKAWHNWTVEDGYCYLHSDKLEDVESVENCVDSKN